MKKESSWDFQLELKTFSSFSDKSDWRSTDFESNTNIEVSFVGGRNKILYFSEDETSFYNWINKSHTHTQTHIHLHVCLCVCVYV